MGMNLKTAGFEGWRRENGRMGVRNHVIILPVDDLSNAAAEAVANNIKGAMAIPHSYGRLQFGADLELHFRTLIGTGTNPNVAAVIVIGIEPGWTGRVVEGILPHRRQRLRQALGERQHAGLRRDERDHGRREPGGRALPHARDRGPVHGDVRPLPARDRDAQDE